MANNISSIIRQATRTDTEKLHIVIIHDNEKELNELFQMENISFFCVESEPLNMLRENVSEYAKLPENAEYDFIICTSRDPMRHHKSLQLCYQYHLPLYAKHFASHVKANDFKEAVENLLKHTYIGLP